MSEQTEAMQNIPQSRRYLEFAVHLGPFSPNLCRRHSN